VGRVNAAPADRLTTPELLAGFMATTAIFVAAIAVVRKPLLLSLAALVLSLVAAGLPNRYGRLIPFAVGAATASFVLGMAVAVITGRPLY
jgi:hypothetical protein